MDELISKRMAIDTFKDCAENGVGIDGIVDALESLPPAQLDFDMIEKIDKAYDDGYKQGYLQAKSDYEADMREKTK